MIHWSNSKRINDPSYQKVDTTLYLTFMELNYENTLPKRNNGSDKAVKRRRKKIQDKAVKNGELTDSFFPFKKFELTVCKVYN